MNPLGAIVFSLCDTMWSVAVCREATCSTCRWAGAPLAVRAHNTVSLAWQQAGPDGVGAQTLWTPESTSLTCSVTHTHTHTEYPWKSDRDVVDQSQRKHAGSLLGGSQCAWLHNWCILWYYDYVLRACACVCVGVCLCAAAVAENPHVHSQ